MAKGYLIFHLNLAFSSIPSTSRPDVIKRCYWPLLEMVQKSGIPIGIELTGWTLSEINNLDPVWVTTFRELLNDEKCELIGSGWSQLIGPLVPYEVNKWNQELGIERYKQLLGKKPGIVLVNEMAFSTSMVDVYKEVGYEGMIMDRNNIRLALDIEKDPITDAPTHAAGTHGNDIALLWSDAILFQRFQRVIHRDIPAAEYIEYLQEKVSSGEKYLPIYTNDAEVFNYRPGRFTTENKLDNEDEWERVNMICKTLSEKKIIEWVSPSAALQLISGEGKKVSVMTSVTQPIPVKKQAKYNINRWANTGRDDLWLNTQCHKIYRNYMVLGMTGSTEWKNLCELWSSDFRTHITADRWSALLQRLEKMAIPNPPDPFALTEHGIPVLTEHGNSHYSSEKDEEGIYWTIKTKNIRLTLNVRRGLTIKSLAFGSHGFKPVIGAVEQGHFESINYGVDYYSGGVLIEMPGKRKRITDLEWVEPELFEKEKTIIIKAVIPVEQGSIEKYINIDLEKEEISLRYQFIGIERPLGIVRVGTLTFLEAFLTGDCELSCFNGGNRAEVFPVDKDCEHVAAVSALVSSTTCLGSPGGYIALGNDQTKLYFRWKPERCAAIPMFKYKHVSNKILSRLTFSLAELDDTSKEGGRLLPFEFSISTN